MSVETVRLFWGSLMRDEMTKPRTRRKAYGPEFGEWLKAIRESQGLSMRQLAAKTPREEGDETISAATISRLESGDRNPSRRMVIRIAAALSVNPADGLRFVGFDTEENRKNVRKVTLKSGDKIEINPSDPNPEATIAATEAFLQAFREHRLPQ